MTSSSLAPSAARDGLGSDSLVDRHAGPFAAKLVLRLYLRLELPEPIRSVRRIEGCKWPNELRRESVTGAQVSTAHTFKRRILPSY